jgi:hypothetical protein
MREIVFRLLNDHPGQLEARAEQPPLTIRAATLEDLQHEAREALIQYFGASHGAYRVRLRRPVRFRALSHLSTDCEPAARHRQRC